MTGCADKGKAVCVFYLDFRKALDTVSHSILVGMLSGYRQDGQTSRTGKNWLDYCTQRTVVNGSESNKHLVRSGSPQSSVQGLMLLNTFGVGSSSSSATPNNGEQLVHWRGRRL